MNEFYNTFWHLRDSTVHDFEGILCYSDITVRHGCYNAVLLKCSCGMCVIVVYEIRYGYEGFVICDPNLTIPLKNTHLLNYLYNSLIKTVQTFKLKLVVFTKNHLQFRHAKQRREFRPRQELQRPHSGWSRCCKRPSEPGIKKSKVWTSFNPMSIKI